MSKGFALPHLITRLLRDEEGSYLLYMTATIPIFIGLAAFATEGTLLFYNHRTIQSAADSAAYSVAIAYSNNSSISSADMTTQAEAIVANYWGPSSVGTGNNLVKVDPPTILTNYAGSGQKAIKVDISRPQTPILSSLWIKNPFNVGGSAIALLDSGASGNCLLALGKQKVGGVTTTNASDAIHVQGNAGLNMPGCGVFSNSTDCVAAGGLSIDVIGNAKIIAGSVGTAGCIDVQGNAKIGPPPKIATQNDGPIMDPYAGVPIPTTSSSGGCTPTASTLCPGVYPSGITLKGGTTTLQPGIYILESAGGNPAFQVGPGGGGSGTIVNGTGVTLVFTSATPNVPSSYPSTMMSFDSKADVHLTAPTTGPTEGFVIMGDSTMPLTTTFKTWANATVADLNGTIYLPNGFMDWGGNADTTVGCRQFIVNTISLQGDPKLNNNGCNLVGGQKPIGSIVTLVK